MGINMEILCFERWQGKWHECMYIQELNVKQIFDHLIHSILETAINDWQKCKFGEMFRQGGQVSIKMGEQTQKCSKAKPSRRESQSASDKEL